jgi:DNA replication protein DnaC
MRQEDIEYLKHIYSTNKKEYFIYVDLVNAGIPLQYRNFEFSDLTNPQIEQSKKKLMSYLDELATKGLYSPKIRGKGFYIYGSHGSAKTALVCVFAKEVRRRTPYSVYYVPFLEMVNSFRDRFYEFIRPNFLIIDDFGNYSVPSILTNEFEHLIKSRYSKGNPTVITSYLEPTSLGEVFGKGFYSLLFECFYFIDHRKVDDWRRSGPKRTAPGAKSLR